jgi:transcriptional pleiotropic regulator of transition state genes
MRMAFVRRLDELGRIVIPKEIRDSLDWTPRTPIEMLQQEEGVILRSFKPGCYLCDSLDTTLTAVNLGPFTRLLCGQCIAAIKGIRAKP